MITIKKNLIEKKNVLISAHGNSLRALCKYLFNISDTKINELEIPSWDTEVIDDYKRLAELFDLEVTLPMQTSRGCTFKCTFCSETRLYRYKNNEKIVGEMKGLEEQTGINNFWFTDSLINGSMPLFKKLVGRMETEVENGNIPKMYWGGHFRTHKKLDGELLTRAVGVGLNYMNVGIENGSDKLSENYSLGMNLTKSTITYTIIALIVILIFNMIAGSVLQNTING